MRFRIRGLSPEPFQHLFGLADSELAKHGAIRYQVDKRPGYPDRIEVRDCEPGESVLLVNYVHQPANTPYRASHAVFVREGATVAYDQTNEIPNALRIRPISLRAFDAHHLMVDADLATGDDVGNIIERFFANEQVAYIMGTTRSGVVMRHGWIVCK